MAKLSQIANEIGFIYEKPFAYGNWKGFDVTVKEIPQEARISISFQVEAIGPDTFNMLLSTVNGMKKQWGVVTYSFDKFSVNIDLLNPYSTMSKTKLANFFDAVISEFERLQIIPNDSCYICGEKENLIPMKYNGILTKAHQTCKEAKLKEIIDSSANEPVKNPHAFNGIFGAFIGAAIGSIPWVIVELSIGLFAAVLGILIGYSAFFFYKKFGGAVTPKTKYVILIATIFGVLFTNILIASYIIVQAGGAIVLENYLYIYTETDVALPLLQDLGLGLLISLFALPAVLRKVRSEEKVITTIE